MKAITLLLISSFATAGVLRAQAPHYPPLREYLMPRDSEIALAKTAAPQNVSSHATIEVLTPSGFEVASTGDNGFVCEVMRGWAAPTFTPVKFRDFVYDASLRAPICFDAVAAKSVLPYYEFRSALGMAGKSPDQMAEAVQAAYKTGKLPKREPLSFAYMFSPMQMLGQGIGRWHPHVMVFAPYYSNAMLGDNDRTSASPRVSDDEGTAFTVVVIPVDRGWNQ